MTSNPELEARVAALEERLPRIEVDATEARLLSAAVDRDIAELTRQVNANTRVINALGEQTAAGFAEVNRQFAEVNRQITEANRRFTGLEAGQQQIVTLLTRALDVDE